MPNPNYLAGRRFEYERMKHYREVMKHDVVRTAGSHGAWDLVVIDPTRGIVILIQCKVCSTHRAANLLLDRFRHSSPYQPMARIHQCLEVKVKGSTEVLSCTV